MKVMAKADLWKLAKEKGLPDLLTVSPSGKTIYGWVYHQKGDLHLPEGEEGQIAIWATMEKAYQEGMTEEARLVRMTTLQMEWRNLPYPAPILMKALISGDHVLFRKVSKAMEFLKKEGIRMRPGGIVEADGVGNNAQSYIIHNWERWETKKKGRKTPVKERLDEMEKKGLAITLETYNRMVKTFYFVSDETPSV